MKRLFALISLMLCASLLLRAVPAKPGGIVFTQPDGSSITLYLHGDEFHHWLTDESGYVFSRWEDGWYRRDFSIRPSRVSFSSTRRRQSVAQMRSASLRRAQTTGSPHIPVILVEFSDNAFSISDPQAAFTALLNQNGYSANGGTGSVRDYYIDNSGGLYQPVFEVLGPVKLTRKMAYYGANDSSDDDNDKYPEMALYEALQQLDATVDFSIFDSDGDGRVEMTLFYYAGYNEAEGGPANSIWPHQWSLDGSDDTQVKNNSFDGVHFGNYFCTSELKGSSGATMCGIGTTCHEFAHSLGLPDFYDTDYGENEKAGALYKFSLMCSGPYNNNGNTPPFLNAEERVLLGWMDGKSMKEISHAGQITLHGVQYNEAAKSSAIMEGEYFIYEARDGRMWDSPLPAGLLIYHVDKTKERHLDRYTPYDLWTSWSSTNKINAFGTHPCFYLIPSGSPESLNYTGSSESIVFPGIKGVREYSPVDWDGNSLGIDISQIKYSDYTVTFSAVISSVRGVRGFVTDTSGKPLEGVIIHVDPVETVATSGKSRLVSVRSRGRRSAYVVQTDASGCFEVTLEDPSVDAVEVSAYFDGYISDSKTVTLKTSGNTISFALRRVGEPVLRDLYKFDYSMSEVYPLGEQENSPIMGSVRFTAEELAPYAGLQIASLSFLPTCMSAESMYVIIDFDNERQLTYPVESPKYREMNDISLRDLEIVIPEGRDVYFGYAVGQSDRGALGCFLANGFNDSYYSEFSLETSDWQELITTDNTCFDLILTVGVLEPADDPGTVDPGDTSLAGLGYNIIDLPEGDLTAGMDLPLRIIPSKKGAAPVSMLWKYDGEDVTGESILLTAGEHTLKVTLIYESGDDETIEVEFDVL